jgi:hypothetical protein
MYSGTHNESRVISYLSSCSQRSRWTQQAAKAGRSAAVAAAAAELTDLMKGDEQCQRYARTCKALDALVAQVRHPPPPFHCFEPADG